MKRNSIKFLLSSIVIAVYLVITAFFTSDSFDLLSFANKTFQAGYLNNAEVTSVTYTYRYIDESSDKISDKIKLYDNSDGRYNSNQNNANNNFTVDKDQDLKLYVTVEGNRARNAAICTENCQAEDDNYAANYAVVVESPNATGVKWDVRESIKESTSTKTVFVLTPTYENGNIDGIVGSYVMSLNYGTATTKFAFNISKYYYSQLSKASISTQRIEYANIATEVTYSGIIKFLTKQSVSENEIRNQLKFTFEPSLFSNVSTTLNKAGNNSYEFKYKFKNNTGEPNKTREGTYTLTTTFGGIDERYNCKSSLTATFEVGSDNYNLTNKNNTYSSERTQSEAKKYVFIKKIKDKEIEVCTNTTTCDNYKLPTDDEGKRNFPDWKHYLTDTTTYDTAVTEFNGTNYAERKDGNFYYKHTYSNNNNVYISYYKGTELRYRKDINNSYTRTVNTNDCTNLKKKNDDFFNTHHDELSQYELSDKYACIALDNANKTASKIKFMDDGTPVFKPTTNITFGIYSYPTQSRSEIINNGVPTKLKIKINAEDSTNADDLVRIFNSNNGRCTADEDNRQACENKYIIKKNMMYYEDNNVDPAIFPRFSAKRSDGNSLELNIYYREGEKDVNTKLADSGMYKIVTYIKYCYGYWCWYKTYTLDITIIDSELYYYTYSNNGVMTSAFTDIISNDIATTSGTNYRNVGCLLTTGGEQKSCTKSDLITNASSILYDDELKEYIRNNNAPSDKYYFTELFDYKTDEFLNTVLVRELTKMGKKGFPGNIDYAQSLGLYTVAKNGTNYTEVKQLSNYNMTTQIFAHNVGKNSENNYYLYDTTRYKLKITGFNKVIDSTTKLLDESASTIKYKLYKYPVNGTVYEGAEPIQEETNVATFRTRMAHVDSNGGLDVSNAFADRLTTTVSADLIDHIALDGDQVYFTYSTDKKITGYATANNIDGVEVPVFLTYSNNTSQEPKKANQTNAVMDDYYYLIRTSDFEDNIGVPMTYKDSKSGKVVSFEGILPEYGTYIFETKNTVLNNLSLDALSQYDVSDEYFNISLNPACETDALNPYSNVGTVHFKQDGIDYTRDCVAKGSDIECTTYQDKYQSTTSVVDLLSEKLAYCSSESHVISPKKNVPKGSYFVYIKYNNSDALGYTTDINPFSRKDFPELYQNNSHMTRLSYSEPVYTMTYGDVTYNSLSLAGDLDNAFENIINQIYIPITFVYNYDENLGAHVKYVVEKQDATGNWVPDANNYGFKVDATLYPTINQINDVSTIQLSNYRVNSSNEYEPVEVGSGKYRLGVTYGSYSGSTFNAESNTYYKEFDVKGRYYSLRMEEKLNFAYYHNIAEEIDAYNENGLNNNINLNDIGVILKTDSIPNREDIQVKITSKTTPSQTFVSKKTNEKKDGRYTIFNVTLGTSGPLAFRYYFTDERIILEHIQNVADVGEYEITLTYEEDNNSNFKATDTQTFYVLDDKHHVEIKDAIHNRTKQDMPEAYADENGMHLVYYVDCQYIPYEEREHIYFEIDKYVDGEYREVTSSVTSHFDMDVEWIQYRNDSFKDLIYQAKITFTVDTRYADLNYKYYYLFVHYGAVFGDSHEILPASTDTYDWTNLKPINELFKWQINTVKTTATMHDSGDTDKITNTVTKDQGFVNSASYNSNLYLYNNLYNQSLEVNLTSPRLDVVGWAINDGNETNVTYNGHNNSFAAINDTRGSSAAKKTLTLYYLNNLYHTVESASETVTSIAEKYNLAPSAIAQYNGISVNSKLTVGKAYRLSPSPGLALTPGVYRLVIYYANDDYQVVNFTVINNYANIILNSALINGKAYDKDNNHNMFNSSADTMDIDLTLEGLEYNSPYLGVYVTDANNNNTINNMVIDEFFTGLYVTIQNKVHITKPANTRLPAGRYFLHIKYSKAETSQLIYTKELLFEITVGTVYFDFTVGHYSSNPTALVTGTSGTISYPITTSNIPNLFTGNPSPATIFKNNTKVYMVSNGKKIDVTNYFRFTAIRISDTQFYLWVSYNAGAIPTGLYYIETAYTQEGLTKTYSGEKDNYFLIGSYSKTFNVTETVYNNLPTDGKLHNNLTWDVTYKYEGDNVFPLYMSASVYNAQGQDVSAYFDVTKDDGEIKLSYDKSPKIAKGNYTVRLTYYEHSNDVPYVKEVPLNILGSYKEIVISNLVKGSSTIYADYSNQYYTFKVDKTTLTTEELNALKAVIYDADGNVYYSEIDSSIEKKFNVTNTASSNGIYTINILPFKARVGTYKVALYLPNEDYPDEYDESNFLEFTIDDTKYKVTIADTSTIEPKVVYNDDSSKAYDKDGVIGNISFTSNVPNMSTSRVTIGVYDGLTLIKTITPDVTNSGSNYTVTFNSGELSKTGDLDFAVCIDGLPYSWLTKTINKYVPITELTVTIGNKTYGDNAGIISIPQTTNTSFAINYKPANATDVSFKTSFSDLTKVSIMNNYLVPNETGETELTIENSDITKKYTIRVSSYLSSSTYEVDNENLLILIKHVSSTTISRIDFERNLENLTSDRTYTKVSTNQGVNIATGDKLSNGGFTYTIVLFGDINRNGSIDLGDVSRLYGAAIGTRALDSITKLATDINGNKTTDLSDVSRLYRYIIGNSTGY